MRCPGRWGEKSPADEIELREMYGEYYSDPDYETVKGAGHWIEEEKPAEFVEKVVEWIDWG